MFRKQSVLATFNEKAKRMSLQGEIGTDVLRKKLTRDMYVAALHSLEDGSSAR